MFKSLTRAIVAKPFDLWSFSVLDIAIQITLIEFNFYKVMPPPIRCALLLLIIVKTVHQVTRISQVSLDKEEREEASTQHLGLY